MSFANPGTPAGHDTSVQAPSKDGGLDPSQDRFKLSLQSDFANAYAGVSIVSMLRDNGINIPRKIELKIKEQYVSRTAYAQAIAMGIVVGIGLGVVLFIYVFEDSSEFKMISGEEGDLERFGFFMVGMTIGMFLGHGATQGGYRCDPTNQRVISENKSYNLCLDDSDCTNHVDRGKGMGLCRRGTDHGTVGILRSVGLYLPPLLSVVLLVAAHLKEGLQISAGHRTMASFFGLSIGIIFQVVFSNYHKVHAAPT